MNLWQDIRYGERMLRKSPGFATTAVFSVCDALLWKPIALPHLESLVMVLQRVPDSPNDWNSAAPSMYPYRKRPSCSWISGCERRATP